MVREFYRAGPLRMATVFVMILLAGLLEGVSVIALLPLLSTVAGQEAGELTQLGQAVNDIFAFIGVTPTLAGLLSVIVVGILLKSLLTLVALRLSGKAAIEYAAELRLMVIRALLRARWTYFVSQRSGRISNAINQEAGQAASSYSAFVSLAAAGFQVAVYCLIALFSTWQVTLLGLTTGDDDGALAQGLRRSGTTGGAQPGEHHERADGAACRGLAPHQAAQGNGA